MSTVTTDHLIRPHGGVLVERSGARPGDLDSLEVLRSLGCRIEVGRASGGGARSDLWLEIVASVLGLPLERTEVEEGAAYGAALLGGVAGGVFADVREAVETCVRVRDAIEPSPATIEPAARIRRGPSVSARTPTGICSTV